MFRKVTVEFGRMQVGQYNKGATRTVAIDSCTGKQNLRPGMHTGRMRDS